MTALPWTTTRAVAWSVCGLGLVSFLLLAALLVPWDPVPGGTPPPVAASDLFTAEELERAESYSARARTWSWLSLSLSLVLLGVLGLTRAGRRLMARLPGPWWVRTLLGVLALVLGVRLVTLPFAWAAWRLRLDVGLSTQSWQGWAGDLVRSELLEAAVLGAVLLVLLGAARRWSGWWPAVAAGVLGTGVLLGSFVYPVLVEPVFHDFEPLPPGDLREAVTEVARAEGVRIDEVVVADASRRTTTLNAWVSGLGGTRRVVLYDNLVDEVPQEQVMAVVAHELAHARHDDVLVGTLLGTTGVVLGVGVLALAVTPRRGTARRPRRADGPGPVLDVRSVPLLVLVLMLGAQAVAPVENAVSRRVEARADVTALSATDDPQAMEELQVDLARRSLADPTPPRLSHWWWGSHPGVLTRVAVARSVGG